MKMTAQIVDAEFVRSHIGKTPIVDVRPKAMYDEGHIPTAIDICVMDFDRFGPTEAEELAKEYRRHALTEEGPMIVYCQIGKHAKQACDLLESQGFHNMYLYSGSFDDWTSDSSRPIEK